MISSCPTCKKSFESKRKNHKYCSNKCWWKSPKGIRLTYKMNFSKEAIKKKRALALAMAHSPAGQNYRRWFIGIKSLRKAINLAGGRAPERVGVVALFSILQTTIKNRKFNWHRRFGKPDAQEQNVEFKMGEDNLRFSQLLYDASFGNRGKVRWFPSWDSLERMLERKGKDESILFGSYLSYLKWGEQRMLKTINTKRRKDIWN